MKDVDRFRSIFGCKDFNGPIEQFAGDLDLCVVAVDAVFSFPSDICLERLVCDEMREMFFLLLLMGFKRVSFGELEPNRMRACP